MDLEDVQPGLLIWRRELNFPNISENSQNVSMSKKIYYNMYDIDEKILPVNSARAEQGRVQNVNPVGGHDHLDEK